MENQKLVDFLQRNRQEIYTIWKSLNLSSSDPIMKNEIINNAISFYDILIRKLQNNEKYIQEDLRALTVFIASRRVKAKSPLIDILSNFSLLRTALLNYISKHFTLLSNEIETVDQFIHEVLEHTILNFVELQNKNHQTTSISDTHKQRLTLLGQMTSSFVHEFRNPLTSIKGFVQLLKSENPSLKYIDIILDELEQLNARISQFLLLSRKEETESSPSFFTLGDLVEDIILFIYPSTVNANVTISTAIEKDMKLFGQREEIRQVLLNILLNALEVLANTPNPIITISGFQTTTCIKIIVTNNGPEIKQEILSNIFQPFITTKQSGTGLGLFVCKEIIEKHNGVLSCTTSEAETCFIITFPKLKEDQ